MRHKAFSLQVFALLLAFSLQPSAFAQNAPFALISGGPNISATTTNLMHEVSVAVVVTNVPAHGNYLTNVGLARTWTTNAAPTNNEIAIGATTAACAYSLYTNLTLSPLTGLQILNVTYNGTTGVTITGDPGQQLSAAIVGTWATVTQSTNSNAARLQTGQAADVGLQITYALAAATTGTTNCSFIFARSLDGSTWESSPYWTIAVPSAGVTTSSLVTNLSLGGVGWIRLQSVQNPCTNAITNLVINAAAKRN